MELKPRGTNPNLLLANYYLGKLKKWNQEYMQGEEGAKKSLRKFDEKYDQILHIKKWIDENRIVSPETAKICSEFPRAGGYIFGIRISPEDNMNWAKVALEAARFLKDRQLEITHLGQIARSLLFMGRPEESINFNEEALKLISEPVDEILLKIKSSLLGNIAIGYMNMGKVDIAIEKFKENLNTARSLKDNILIGLQLGNLGIAYTKIGSSDTAIEYLSEYLELNQKINNSQGVSYAYNSLGTAYLTLGKTEEAIDYYNQSLVIKRRLNDEFGIANSLLNLGIAYLDIKQSHEAIERLEEALIIITQVGNTHNDLRTKGKTLGYLGISYYQLDQFEKALDYHEREVSIALEVKDNISLGVGYKNLGYVYWKMKNHEKSRLFLDKALKLSRETGDKHCEAASLFGMGNIEYEIGEKKCGLELANKSLSTLKKIGSKHSQEVETKIAEWTG